MIFNLKPYSKYNPRLMENWYLLMQIYLKVNVLQMDVKFQSVFSSWIINVTFNKKWKANKPKTNIIYRGCS